MNNNVIPSNMTVYDYTINYTISLNTSLDQVRVLLGKFQEDNYVLDNPSHTIIIALYCALVSLAGKIAVIIYRPGMIVNS